MGAPPEWKSRGPPPEWMSRGPPPEWMSRGAPPEWKRRGAPSDWKGRRLASCRAAGVWGGRAAETCVRAGAYARVWPNAVAYILCECDLRHWIGDGRLKYVGPFGLNGPFSFLWLF
jgi:hypothetical protein